MAEPGTPIEPLDRPARLQPETRVLAAAVVADLAELRAELATLSPANAERAWQDLRRRIGTDPDALRGVLRDVDAGREPPEPSWLATCLLGLALYYDGACRGLSHWIPDADRCLEMREVLSRRQAHAHALASRLGGP